MKSWLQFVELEIRELLTQYKFPGDTTPIVRGSALKARLIMHAASLNVLFAARSMNFCGS